MLVNTKEMLLAAKEGKYAIPQFNINNLEWTKNILELCVEEQVPVILGVSEGAAKYMGGFAVVSAMVKELMKSIEVSIDVALHLDHGTSFESCKAAIDAGFSSVMIDASQYELDENIKITQEVVDYAHDRGITVEAEVGHVGGSEDGIVAEVLNASLEDCIKLTEATNIDSLAPALGSVHGLYVGEPNLDFDAMKEINEILEVPLVLHGGTGIPDEQILKAIDSGMSKININTELQIAWHSAVKDYIDKNPDSYDPRVVIGSGKEAMKKAALAKINLFFKRS